MVAFAATAAASRGDVGLAGDRRPARFLPVEGALAGLVVGLLAHPLCWFLVTAFQTVRDPILRDASYRNIGFDLVFMSIWISVSSLGLVGWITAPLGADPRLLDETHSVGKACEDMRFHYNFAHVAGESR